MLDEVGEDEALFCDGCDYAANAEKAELKPDAQGESGPWKTCDADQKTIEEAARSSASRPSRR